MKLDLKDDNKGKTFLDLNLCFHKYRLHLPPFSNRTVVFFSRFYGFFSTGIGSFNSAYDSLWIFRHMYRTKRCLRQREPAQEVRSKRCLFGKHWVAHKLYAPEVCGDRLKDSFLKIHVLIEAFNDSNVCIACVIYATKVSRKSSKKSILSDWPFWKL